MSNKRVKFTPNQNILLVSQVGGCCPLCGTKLMYDKAGRTNKNYENAHIYPLNPKHDELKLLKNEKKLSNAPNDLNNIIPICNECHNKFDNPRTVEEYRKLVAIKEELIKKDKQNDLSFEYPIEKQIIDILELIEGSDFSNNLRYEPLKLESKFDGSMPSVTEKKISFSVTEYFYFVQEQLEIKDTNNEFFSESLCSQVRTFYIQQKKQSLSQRDVFNNLVNWILSKSQSNAKDGAEIIVSFFIQNCEVFDDNTQ